MTQVGKSSRSPLKVITAIVAVIVVIIFVAATYQIREVSQGHTVSYDSRDYLYEAEAGRFGDLYETAVQDMDKHTTYSTVPCRSRCRCGHRQPCAYFAADSLLHQRKR